MKKKGRSGPAVETESSRPSPQPSKEPGETSSVTEDDNSEDDSDSRDAQYRCQHCFTTSITLCHSMKSAFLLNKFVIQIQEIGKLPVKTDNYFVGIAERT